MDQLTELDPTILHRQTELRRETHIDTWERDVTVVAILWKNKTFDPNFRMPIQQLYGGENIDSAEIQDRYAT